MAFLFLFLLPTVHAQTGAQPTAKADTATEGGYQEKVVWFTIRPDKAQKLPDLHLEFRRDKTTFKDERAALEEVKRLGEYLVSYPQVKIVLKGHGEWPEYTHYADCQDGDEDCLKDSYYNTKGDNYYDLLLARANRVKDLIVNKYHVDPSRITPKAGSLLKKANNQVISVDQIL